MKNLILTWGSLLFIVFSTSAYESYNKPFIFLESGIEFAVFKDGQFDFNILKPQATSLHIQTNNINFSFNSGHNYDTFIQYDNYGAVIQIENIPISYDYYGRVIKIGYTSLLYNSLGLVYRIGNLNIGYNYHGMVQNCTGYINNYSINYSHQPHHRYYCTPIRRKCIVNTYPYRKNYNIKRYNYSVHKNNYYTNNHNTTKTYYSRNAYKVRSKNYSRTNQNQPNYNRQKVNYGRSYKNTNRSYLPKSTTNKQRSYTNRPSKRQKVTTLKKNLSNNTIANTSIYRRR